MDKLLESLRNVTQQTIGLPRLPKALSTTMPTFNGKNNKFEHFKDLFMTSLKVYPNIPKEEQIHYFHSLLRDHALQTYRNMTDTNRVSLDDIIATFRRRYVRPNLSRQPAANGNNSNLTNPNKLFKTSWSSIKNWLKKHTGTTPPSLSRPPSTPKCQPTSNES